jgi:hypothetical protein
VGVVAEIVARLHCVVTQEVHGFAHFGDGVGEGLAGFTGQQAHQRLDLASIRSAARSRIAARSAGGVACQIGACVQARWSALSTSSTVAS